MESREMILKAAFLCMCPCCRLHGYIALPDGSRTGAIIIRKFAFEEVARLVKEKKIDDAEALFLREQINASDLLYEGNGLSWAFRVDEALTTQPENCGALLDETPPNKETRTH